MKFTTGFTYWTEDQSVSVDGSAARGDMTSWHLGDPRFGVTGTGIAHEIGHMLGLKDEYVDPVYYPGKVPAADGLGSVMGPDVNNPLLDRQMQEILDYSHYKDHIPGTYVLARR